MTVVMSSREGMGCKLIRKHVSFEGLVLFFFLSSCFLTIKRSVSNYPLHRGKVYELSDYVDHVLLKLNKSLFIILPVHRTSFHSLLIMDEKTH